MRKLSLKVKLTLVYTMCMIFVIGVIFGLLFSISNREVLASAQVQLKNRVQESMEDIAWENGVLKIDSDFYQIEEGVYLSVYDEEDSFLYGKIPHGFLTGVSISDDEVQKIQEDKTEWYVYDLQLQLQGKCFYIRGITSVTDTEESFLITIRIALILLPLTVLLVGILVYHITRRTLLPVKTITETVQEIQQDADLSKRIRFNKEREEKKQDEIVCLARTFNEMLEQLEKVFEREKQFTSDVSHELRTPVSVILAQCEACLTDENLNAEQHRQIELIQKKARTVAELISHLLMLSRADQGKIRLYLERVNVSELLEMIVEEQKVIASEREMTIRTQIEPKLCTMLDETLYIRMMDNLISNAISYGREGGIIEVTLRQEKEELYGVIKDNGIGIAKEQLPHIWERFYRVDKSRTDRNHSGLGLSMVKWIVEEHGGEITVESQEGEGTTFTYVFPVRNE